MLFVVEFTRRDLVLDASFQFRAIGDVLRRRVKFDALPTPNIAVIEIDLYRRFTSDAHPWLVTHFSYPSNINENPSIRCFDPYMTFQPIAALDLRSHSVRRV